MARLSIVAALCVLQHTVTSLVLPEPSDSSLTARSARFLHAPLNAVDARSDRGRRDVQRRSTKGVGSTLVANLQRRYTIDVTVGGQQTTLEIDTGSAEMWVNPNCSAAQSTLSLGSTDLSAAYCETIGRYDPADSDTAVRVSDVTGSVSYGDKSFLNMDYYQDTVEVAGLSIAGQQFGAVTSSGGIGMGIFGLAPDLFHGYNQTPPTPNAELNRLLSNATYELPLSSMATQGLIERVAFSLDLRDDNETHGSLIFGGIDKSKFSNKLFDVGIYPRSTAQIDGYNITNYGYDIEISSLGITTKAGSKTLSGTGVSDFQTFKADLDAGTPNNIVPAGYVEPACDVFGGQYADGFCFVRCDSRRYNVGTIDFGFGGAKGTVISVSYNNSVTEINIADFAAVFGMNASEVAAVVNLKKLGYTNEELSSLSQYDGYDAALDSAVSADQTDGSIPTLCYLNFMESNDSSSWILGAPFLRDAYAVFDWEAPTIYLGQAADCGADVVAFETGSGGIPTSGNCKSTKQTFEELPASMRASTGSSSDSGDAVDTGDESSDGDSVSVDGDDVSLTGVAGTVDLDGDDKSSKEVVDMDKDKDDDDDDDDDNDDDDKNHHDYNSKTVWEGAIGAALGVVLLSGGLFLGRYVAAKRARRRGLLMAMNRAEGETHVDEVKVPLVSETVVQQEYGRLNQIPTAYDSPTHHYDGRQGT